MFSSTDGLWGDCARCEGDPSLEQAFQNKLAPPPPVYPSVVLLSSISSFVGKETVVSPRQSITILLPLVL